ncbi:hypothetical protein BN1708_004036 [Verticillium longisporum]|uniref:3'(2'),5'-bisphosphate nucleotidase n=1 Tax=Verticillium longisporum TaxID=100787 RepID=A0A0G4LV78_VERLO|nr:hypothetical protein BN1708_004036 [Verticillium longisporum]
MHPTLNFVTLAVAAAVAAVVLAAWRRVYRHPLSKFPGPKWAASTLWVEFYWDVVRRGIFMWKIREMHSDYGPIVRINPHELHVSDPDFFDDLYVANRRLDNALNPFFSARAVTALEPVLRAKVDKLAARFEAIARTGEVVRLDAAFMALTMDIICDYAFAADRGYLDEPDFKLQWKETILGAFEGGALSRQFPWILPVMKGLPLPVVSAINPAVGHLFWWQQSVRKQVGPILEGVADSAGARQTIFHALRDSPLPQQEKTLDRLCDEAEILTGAGSETTAQAITRLMFYLKHAPETLVKVRRELDGVVRQGGQVPSWIELQRLPYLSAAIKEAIRLSYGVTTRLPRICHEDIRYKDWIIPAGTPISMTPHDVLTDPDVFPEPHTYRPERWLEAGTAGRKLDRYFVPFGKGARQCPGMNLAHAEMFLTASTIISRFDWELFETGLDDVTCQHDFFVAVAKLDSKGQRAAQRADSPTTDDICPTPVADQQPELAQLKSSIREEALMRRQATHKSPFVTFSFLLFSFLTVILAIFAFRALPRLSLIANHLPLVPLRPLTTTTNKPAVKPPTMALYAKELEIAQLAVQRAAILTKRVFHEKAKGTVDKNDKSPVTIGDFGAQALIIAALRHHFPEDDIVAEEEAAQLREDDKLKTQIWDLVRETRLSDAAAEALLGGGIETADEMLDLIDAGNSKGGAQGRIWAIDPIDGTKGFLRGGQYAVCLGLMVDGDVKVGVLGCPNLPVDDAAPLTADMGANATDDEGRGVLFSAVQTRGATSFPLRDGALAAADGRAIAMRPLSDMTAATFCESVEAGHSAHGDQAQIAQRLGITRPSVRMDSQSKYGSIARGAGDIYLRLPVSASYQEKIWDHAAGDLIVREAGGQVTDIAGQRLDFSVGRTLAKNKGVVAAPAAVHAEVLKVVQEVLNQKTAA